MNMKLIKIIKQDKEILYIEQKEFNVLKEKGFGTFPVLQNKMGVLRFFNKRKLYTHTFETTKEKFEEHNKMSNEFKAMNGVEMVNVPIDSKTKFILVFENRHDRYVFQDLISKEFSNKVAVVDTNGKDSKKIKGVMRAIQTTGLPHLFIHGDDRISASIAEIFQEADMNTATLTQIQDKGLEIKSIISYFISKDYYPSWLVEFMPKGIPEASNNEVDKKRLLEIIEEERKTTIYTEGPISVLVNNYFDTIAKRIEQDLSGKVIPLIKSRRDLFKVLYGTNLTKLKKIVYNLPKYVSEEYKQDPLIKTILKLVRNEVS